MAIHDEDDEELYMTINKRHVQEKMREMQFVIHTKQEVLELLDPYEELDHSVYLDLHEYEDHWLIAWNPASNRRRLTIAASTENRLLALFERHVL